MKEAAKQVKLWKSKFRILKSWRVSVAFKAKYKGQIGFGRGKHVTFFPWPEDQETPEDFYFHEMLHIAQRALKQTPRRQQHDTEEQLVQDVCQIYREKGLAQLKADRAEAEQVAEQLNTVLSDGPNLGPPPAFRKLK